MSEAKFTKGKWFIEKDANWNDDCWAISAKRDSDGSVHHCFAEVVYKMEHEEKNEELEANAHLIAAAPDIYHSLKEIVDDARDYESRGGKLPSWVKSAEDALAKARGE